MHHLEGIQDHLDAVLNGDNVDARLAIIRGSNALDDIAKARQSDYLKAFCIGGAIHPLCGEVIDLGDGYSIKLNPPSSRIESGGLPGVRVDSDGWLVIEGEYRHYDRVGLREDERGFPLWPFMIRNGVVHGKGPPKNFLSYALDLLRQGAEVWRYGD